MIVRGIPVGPLEENAWLLVDEASRDAVYVDPGAEPERLLRELEAVQGRLTAIWLTHAHFDHIGGIAGLRAAHADVPIFLHPLDRTLYRLAGQSAENWGIPFDPPPPADRELAEGDVARVGAHAFVVRHVPGHAPGHVMFVGDGQVFSGDLLFAGSIGRTDFPLCDPAAMARSLERIAALPPGTAVHPGHGPSTTVGRELETNPFLNGMARVVGA